VTFYRDRGVLVTGGLGFIGTHLTNRLASLGAREIPRRDFLRAVRVAVAQEPVPAPWHIDADLMTGL